MQYAIAVYIMANKRNGTIYTGVTNNLFRRVDEHKKGRTKGFTQKYNCTILVYYELFDHIYDAITAEKKLKGASRKKKLSLIEQSNPFWQDLSTTLM